MAEQQLAQTASAEEITIFDKIIKGEIPAKVVLEDDLCIAIKDAFPCAAKHFLVIPKNRDGLTGLSKAEERHKDLLGHLMVIAAKVAQQENMAEDGYRIVINDGKHGCQSVYHLHIHVIGGQQLGWPPGVKQSV